ncbi:hypothetical protein MYU51_006279 [Penicillium brevicompactum]
MKSPLWLLTVLLPLATELAAASPAANPDPDSLESLESFDDANEFEERDLEDRQGGSRLVKRELAASSALRADTGIITRLNRVGFVTPTNLAVAREIGSADALEAAFDDLWYL